jgi:8-oxo-dGTP diphosphatase
MVVYAANCHLIKGNKVLLKLANKGVSEGYWNCPGGKMEKGETPAECAIREVKEETGLSVKSLFRHGSLRFSFADGSNPDWVVHLFSSSDFSGTVRDSDEGRLRWFDIGRVPYGKMWDDDRYWFGLILEKRRFDARFSFGKDRKVSSYSMKFRQA